FLRRPTVDGQPESGLGYQIVTFYGLEWSASGIGREFVIAGDHPHFAFVFDANLGRTKDMPCRVERHLYAVDGYRLAVGNGLNSGLIAQADAVERLALIGDQIGAIAAIGMIGMGVC